MKFFKVLLIIAASFKLGSSQIIANPHQFPFIVGINTGQTQCVGTMISRRAILTISECLQNVNSVQVIFGLHDINSITNEPPQLLLMIGRQHFRFEDPVAIIILDPPFAFLSPTINSVDFPFSTPNERFVNVDSQVTGFLRGNPNPNQVRFWNVRTITNQDCSRSNQPPIANHLICLSNQNGCTLMTGSPLIIPNGNRFIQIGIQPSELCGNHSQDRARFIRTTEFLTFIRRHM